MKKNLLLFLLAIVSIFLWFQGPPQFSQPTAPTSPTARTAPQVTISEVLFAPMYTVRTFSGSLESEEQFNVSARAAGTLQELQVDIGDRVRSGQILANLEDSQQSLVVAQASAELMVAIANEDDAASRAQLAQVSMERVRSLHRQNITSSAELDQAEAEWEAQQARLRLAQAQVELKRLALEQAKLQHSYFTITASWNDGIPRVVERRLVQRGAYLASGTPVFTLAKIHTLTATVFLTQADYYALNPGDAVEITVPTHPGEIFHGTVVRKAPAFDELSRHARVEISLPNPELKLQPGMFVQVRWRSESEHPVYQVPHNAITYRNGRPAIFLFDPNSSTVQQVEVHTGREDARMVEVLSPEISGFVIVAGHERLRDGDTVSGGQKKP